MLKSPVTVLADTRPDIQALLQGLAYIDLRVRYAIVRARAHGFQPDDQWRGFYIADDEVDRLLQEVPHAAATESWAYPTGLNGSAEWRQKIDEAQTAWQHSAETSHFGKLKQAFHLSDTELDALLLIIAPELDLRYEKLYAYLQDDATKKRPTVDLVLTLLAPTFSDRLHLRELFSPQSKLISSGLIESIVDGTRRYPTLLGSFLVSAENVVQTLLGTPQLDEKLSGCAELTWPQENPARQTDVTINVERIDALLDRCPILTLVGPYGTGKETVAQHAAQQLEQPLLTLDVAMLDAHSLTAATALNLAIRDGLLHNALLYIVGWDALLTHHCPPLKLLQTIIDYANVVIIASEQDWQAQRYEGIRPIFTIHAPTLTYHERLEIWQTELPQSESLSNLANHFQFTAGQIQDSIKTARNLAEWKNETLDVPHLLEASRMHSNQNLADLATKIPPRNTWQDIILPDDTLSQLRELVDQARMRPKVHEQWGFGKKLAGRGISALFTGEPGTGKTMSADILAGELGLDLYKVELSSLVSKYIGETEKNLDQVFTEANTSNAILFFDEADSIFGKRSEVKDSHDRYANLEVSYLLQRMEGYDGIAILATNMRANLDEAFTRRFDFITDFPFPDVAYREQIWRIHFPKDAPMTDDVDTALLAQRFRIAGGNIKKIVLAAAFLAARQGEPIGMPQLLHAARRDYQKMGRLIEESLFSLES